jgi:hypothetical protein
MAETRIGRPTPTEPERRPQPEAEEEEEPTPAEEEAPTPAALPTTVVVLVTQLGSNYSYGAQVDYATLDTETGGNAQSLLDSHAIVDVNDPAAAEALASAAHVAAMAEVAARNRGIPQ